MRLIGSGRGEELWAPGEGEADLMFFEMTKPFAKIRNRTSSFLLAVDNRTRNFSVWHEGMFLLWPSQSLGHASPILP